jgi:2-polyprenyl-6-methoxyphenol hydroxylase-like FAD-dependent oxidoreductase
MIGTRIVGRIVLIGDAAHIHSPAGGRGMNLGIEDAASFAAALDASTLDGWAAKRLARARTVLQGSDQMQRIVTMSGGFWSRLLLRTVALLVNIPFIQRRIVTVVAAADE